MAGRGRLRMQSLSAAPQRETHLPSSPAKVQRINDAARRPDIGDGDLWTVDDLAAVREAETLPVATMPVFAPKDWGTASRLKQTEYCAEFKRRAPLADFVLQKLQVYPTKLPRGAKVVVAGGGAAAPYYSPGVSAGDIDFFIAGVEPDDRKRLWRTVDCILSVIRGIYDPEHPYYHEAEGALQGSRDESGIGFRDVRDSPIQTLTPGLITVGFDKDFGVDYDIQIILRAYPSVSAIIHAFDVPSSCIAYDGRTTYMSTLGAYAQYHKVNLVSPAYRSTTYERRLIKYFGRGYALGLVDLDPDALRVGQKLELPHIVLAASSARRDGWVEGTVTLPATAAPPQSDYEPLWLSSVDIALYIPAHTNLHQLAAGNHRYCLTRCRNKPDIIMTESPRGEWLETWKWAEGEAEPTLADLLPECDLDFIIGRVVRGACTDGLLRAKSLVRYLGMSRTEVAQLALTLATALETEVLNRPRVRTVNALYPFVRRIRDRYHRAARAPIEWWITQKPERQYTASLNPCMEDPAEWYGAGRVNLGPPRGLSRPAPVANTYGDSCPLCLDPLNPGELNSITLGCGHTFHWGDTAQDNGCEGLSKWFGRGKTTCPTCRARSDGPTRRAGSDGQRTQRDAVPDLQNQVSRYHDIDLRVDWQTELRTDDNSAAADSAVAAAASSFD